MSDARSSDRDIEAARRRILRRLVEARVEPVDPATAARSLAATLAMVQARCEAEADEHAAEAAEPAPIPTRPGRWTPARLVAGVLAVAAVVLLAFWIRKSFVKGPPTVLAHGPTNPSTQNAVPPLSPPPP